MGSMKKRLSLLGVVSLTAIVGLSLTVGVAEAKTLKLEIDADESSFDVIPSPMGQLAFHIKGTIVGGGTGTFRCWGWVLDGNFTNVNQIYSIDGHGALMTQGVEFAPTDNRIAVTGGTGDFRNVRGEGFFGDAANPNSASDFSIEFDLRGARR